MDGKAKSAEIITKAAAAILAGMMSNPQDGRSSDAMLVEAFDLASQLFLKAARATGVENELE